MLNQSRWRSLLTKPRGQLPSYNQLKKRLRNLPLVGWVIIVLCLILILVIIQFVLRFKLPSTSQNLIVAKPRNVSAAPNLNKLAELHLFGQNISNQDLYSLPETSLQLQLKGIYSAPSPELGSAIISLPDGTTKVYLVGDTLPGGAILMDVYEDRVVLRRAGKLEVLALPQKHLELKKQ